MSLLNIAVNQYRYTLSEIGHPCHFDPSRRDCAWCNYNGFQCGNFTKKNQGKYCKKFIHNSYDCYGTSKFISFIFTYYEFSTLYFFYQRF